MAGEENGESKNVAKSHFAHFRSLVKMLIKCKFHATVVFTPLYTMSKTLNVN